MLPFMLKVMASTPKMLASTLTRSIFWETQRDTQGAAMAARLRVHAYGCARAAQ